MVVVEYMRYDLTRAQYDGIWTSSVWDEYYNTNLGWYDGVPFIKWISDRHRVKVIRSVYGTSYVDGTSEDIAWFLLHL